MNKSEKHPTLLPCPFCGGKAEFRCTENFRGTECGIVRCVECHNQTQDVIRENAEEHWNRRPEINAAPKSRSK